MSKGFPSPLDAPMGRIELLDCLRAYAALAVVFGHALPRLAPGGACGVSVFFTLSGYLITRILMREGMMTPRNIGVFLLLRRIARIYPMYFLAVIGMTAWFFFFDPRKFGIVMGNGGEKTFLGILTLQNGPSEWTGYGFGVLWTLVAECGFYITFPFFLWIGLAAKKVLQVFGLIVLASFSAKLVSLSGFANSGIFLQYYDHFILGSLVVVMIGSNSVPRMLGSKWIGLVGLASMFLAVAIPYPGSRNLAWHLLSFLASMGTAMVILYHHLFGMSVQMPVAAFL